MHQQQQQQQWALFRSLKLMDEKNVYILKFLACKNVDSIPENKVIIKK